MLDFGKINVNVEPVITIDDDTAYTLLWLLELYCRAGKKTIGISHATTLDLNPSDEWKVTFDFEDDTFSKNEESYSHEKEAIKMQVPKKLYFEGDGYASDGSMVYDFAKCQICGHEFEEGYAEWGCNYCPNCGNKLDWEGNA